MAREPSVSLDDLTRGDRFNYVQTVLGHRVGLPSLVEFYALHPSEPRVVIDIRLNGLVADGVLKTVDAEHGDDDLPDRFYALTDAAHETLTDHDLLRVEDTLTDLQSRVEATPGYERARDAPRPADALGVSDGE